MILALQTPERISETVPPEKAQEVIGQWETLLSGMDAIDRIYQTDATLAHNILPRFKSLPPAATQHVRFSTLVIVAAHDHAVDPGPAIAFAKSVQHLVLVLDSRCGHVLTYCEAEIEIVRAVRAFLDDTATIVPDNKSTPAPSIHLERR